jgi:hypothetical protein
MTGAPDGRFTYVLCCSVQKLDNLLPEAREFHIDAITTRLVDDRPEVIRTALQFTHFESALESKSALERRWRDLFFFKGKADRTRSWRSSLDRLILNRQEPKWQKFADAELGRPTGNGEFEAPACKSFADFKSICLVFWREHIEQVRLPHFQELKRHVLLNSDVVLCTIDALHNKAMRELWREAGGRLHTIYIDEASLVPEEAMPIIALLNPITLALVGDHEQLRPFSHVNLNMSTGEDKRFNRSFFERCVGCGVRFTMLHDNYRNPPDLVRVLNSMTYHDKLVARCPPTPAPSVVWRDHSHNENDTSEDNPSSKNLGEVQDVARLYRDLKKAREENIMLITFYKGQYQALQVSVSPAQTLVQRSIGPWGRHFPRRWTALAHGLSRAALFARFRRR